MFTDGSARAIKCFIAGCLLFSVAVILPGCSYVGYYTSQAHWHQTFKYFPSMSALNRIDPEDSLILNGPIVRSQQPQEPLLLVAVSNKYREDEKVDLVQLQMHADAYMAFLPPGNYDLYVFADVDQDGDFEGDELVGRASVSVYPERSREGSIIEGPPLTVDIGHPTEVDFHVHEKVRPASSVYTSLDDDFFDPGYGMTGLYNPSEFIAHTQGFLFSLEQYNDKKTTVIFVHGISGTPRDWKFIVGGLDQSRFQPFFFYYPSGLRLDTLATILAESIESLVKSSSDSRHKIVVVAHSMGGLVAMSAIDKLSERGLASPIRMYCSFSTPYGGDEQAQRGVDTAPLVVPVWHDIAAGSPFLKNLAAKPLPKRLPFYLFFSYHDDSTFKLGETSDGAVTLRSQLAPSLQSAATQIMGFDETHDTILTSTSVRDSLLHLLNLVSPSVPSGRRVDGMN